VWLLYSYFGGVETDHTWCDAGEALHSSTGARLLSSSTATAVAVHVGISWTEYARIAAEHRASTSPYSAQGAVLSVGPGRVSYHFGLKGPSVAYGMPINEAGNLSTCLFVHITPRRCNLPDAAMLACAQARMAAVENT